MTVAMIKRIGLFGGPLLGLVQMPQMMKAGNLAQPFRYFAYNRAGRVSFYSEQENFQDSDSETDYSAMHEDRRQRVNEESAATTGFDNGANGPVC